MPEGEPVTVGEPVPDVESCGEAELWTGAEWRPAGGPLPEPEPCAATEP